MKRRNLRFLSLILVILLSLSVLAGCTTGTDQDTKEPEDPIVEEAGNEVEESAFPLEIEDKFGNQAEFEQAPEKIVSLAPSHTEILLALGLGDKVVGIDSNSNYPEEATEKEVVGDYYGTDLEKIIEMEADLVLAYGAGNEEDNARLKEAGIPVLGYMPETIEEVFETIIEIGKITDSLDKANTLVDEMKAKRDEIVDKVKDADKVRVFYEIWHEPLQAAGPGSFMDELINLAGGENIAHDSQAAYAEYDLEQLIERDPEVYLTAEMTEPIEGEEKITAETIAARPGYEDITAIKDGRIYLLDGDIVSRPGPRIIDALELVAKALHEDLF